MLSELYSSGALKIFAVSGSAALVRCTGLRMIYTVTYSGAFDKGRACIYT